MSKVLSVTYEVESGRLLDDVISVLVIVTVRDRVSRHDIGRDGSEFGDSSWFRATVEVVSERLVLEEGFELLQACSSGTT